MCQSGHDEDDDGQSVSWLVSAAATKAKARARECALF